VKEVAQLLNDMQDAGVIENYALFGAIAQTVYTEPVITLDVDVLVAVPLPKRIDPLHGIYEYCAARGYGVEGEAIRVGDWPVQFLLAFNSLTREALERARTVDFEGLAVRVVCSQYLAVIALSTGRSKDRERILSLLESESTNRREIEDLAERHGLTEAWQQFVKRFLDA
jgi:hypothetical protein